jgi:hypothetical protein
VRRKDYEQAKARELRAVGWSLREIAGELGVALSSVSNWVRDVPRAPTPGLATAPPVQTLPLVGLRDFRTCARCEETLPLIAFNRNKTGRQHWCRECFRSYFRERGQRHLDQVKEANIRRRAAARRYINRYLDAHPCRDCGERDPAVMEFDHLDAKLQNVSVLVAWGMSISAIKREIQRCEVVCANCHRRRTYLRSKSWRLDPARLSAMERLSDGRARNLRFVCRLLEAAACSDCGLRDLAVLEFDHVRGEKQGDVTALARSGTSLARIKDEIAKCEVRCANCHRRRTLHAPFQLKLAA